MSTLIPQASFNSGEWAPNLYARVDVKKYASGAALLENFWVDYRGGASTRQGTKYVLQAYKSSYAVRLIPFQATFNTGYVLEFGQNYIRFYYQGSPILENGYSVTGATQANPCVLTIPSHNYSVGDWIYMTNAAGMVQLGGRYFSVAAVSGNNVTLADLNGAAINSTGYSPFSGTGETQRVYTLSSPYAASDLALLKFAQVPNEMVLCHPNYAPRLLTLISAANWSLATITFGSTAGTPTGVAVTSTLTGTTTNYGYEVTSLDGSGQESSPSSPGTLAAGDIATTSGSNKITWTAVTGAEGYNVYKSTISFFGTVPVGIQYGYIGQTTGTTFIDSNITADFSQTPPIAQDPFSGIGVTSVTVGTAGTYATVPQVTFSGGSPSAIAVGYATLSVVGSIPITTGGTGYVTGDTATFADGLVLSLTASGGVVTGYSVVNAGAITSGGTPGNPMSQVSTSGVGVGLTISPAWGVSAVTVVNTGEGYASAPSVIFSPSGAAATANLGATTSGNPSVPSFFQQRLVLAAPLSAPQSFFMSQPGSFYNFNVTSPAEPDNAISETLVSGSLETIKSIVSSTSGMLVLTDKATWLVNGGSSGSAVSPSAIVANRQSSIGASDVPPIAANYDVLYVQSKGSGVRDLAYNIYFNVFTGSDISINANHLFFGYTIKEWAWAEQPFYLVWAVRSDGVMLTLTYVKEQEFVGWTHHNTQGLFKSVCTVTETTSTEGTIDAVYTVVQRTINGNTVQLIERFAERTFPNGLSSAWCLDNAVQYTGASALSFTGAENLNNTPVTALCTDSLGNVTVQTFTMPVGGAFTLPAPTNGATGYTTVLVGLSYTCKLQTLAINVDQEPIQGKLKRIPYVDVRVNNALGLSIGQDFNSLTPMKDLIDGNISSMASGLAASMQVVAGLYSGDARTFLSPSYNIYGQYAIEQSNPYPATVLGLFPCIVLGDN